jgi:hypothetical protein
MSCTVTFTLGYKMAIQAGILFCNIVLDLFAQVTYDKDEILDACITELIDDNTEYGFSR